MTLIGIQPLVDICALILQSSFVKNEPNGASLLIISKPETAKTSTLFTFHNLKFVQYYDELTQKKLLDDFVPMARAGQAKTLVIPDLVNCIEKQRSTRDQFLNCIKSGIDDTGLCKVSTYHKSLSFEGAPVKFNLITAMTAENFGVIRGSIKGSGLLSRLVPFTYSYPLDKIKRILELIEGAAGDGSDSRIPRIIQKTRSIEGSAALFKELEFSAAAIGREAGAYGIRAQAFLQRLAKSSAMLDNRRSVSRTDIDRITHLANWINYNFNEI